MVPPRNLSATTPTPFSQGHVYRPMLGKAGGSQGHTVLQSEKRAVKSTEQPEGGIDFWEATIIYQENSSWCSSKDKPQKFHWRENPPHNPMGRAPLHHVPRKDPPYAVKLSTIWRGMIEIEGCGGLFGHSQRTGKPSGWPKKRGYPTSLCTLHQVQLWGAKQEAEQEAWGLPFAHNSLGAGISHIGEWSTWLCGAPKEKARNLWENGVRYGERTRHFHFLKGFLIESGSNVSCRSPTHPPAVGGAGFWWHPAEFLSRNCL